jgi:hypothetical protein
MVEVLLVLGALYGYRVSYLNKHIIHHLYVKDIQPMQQVEIVWQMVTGMYGID